MIGEENEIWEVSDGRVVMEVLVEESRSGDGELKLWCRRKTSRRQMLVLVGSLEGGLFERKSAVCVRSGKTLGVREDAWSPKSA